MALLKIKDTDGTWQAQGNVGVFGSSDVEPELLYSSTAENVSSFSHDVDFKGHNRLLICIGGSKNSTAVSIQEGILFLEGKKYIFAYYTAFLDETNTSYPYGSVYHDIHKIDQDKIYIFYGKNVTTNDIFKLTTAQESSSSNVSPKIAFLKKIQDVTNNDGFTLNLSASISELNIEIYGY